MEYLPLCETLTALVKESGKRVSAIARECDLSESTVRRILSGEIEDPRYITIRNIVRACGGSIDRILGIGIYANETVHECTDDVQECTEDVQECTSHADMHEPLPAHITNWKEFYTPNLIELFDDAPMGPVGYERALKYIKKEAADAHAEATASYAANALIREQNTELVKVTSRLIEQESATRSRNRGLYVGMIIACIVAGLCLTGLAAYIVYDIMQPTWGIVRY